MVYGHVWSSLLDNDGEGKEKPYKILPVLGHGVTVNDIISNDLLPDDLKVLLNRYEYYLNKSGNLNEIIWKIIHLWPLCMTCFKSTEKYQILFTTYRYNSEVKYEKLALIWNSMHVINISPTAHFQETSQWDNRPSYIGGTYMYHWDQIG